MINVQDIQATLARMAELLRLGGINDWAQAMDVLNCELTNDPETTAAKIVSMFGGMGSLNDVVLYKAGQPLAKENGELDALRLKLYGLCHVQVIATESVADAAGIRARVLSNISETQAGNASSNFGQFVKNEGQLQERLGIWPPNSGGYSPIYNVGLDTGTLLDRFGYPGGNYVSPLGASFEERALPSSYQATKPYFQYEVIQPIPGVTQAKILPWFGQPGMGTQFQLPNSVQWYLDNGYMKVIPK